LAKAMIKTKTRPPSSQWGNFLRNHDELDLGRLSKKQRQTVFSAFGPNAQDQLYERWADIGRTFGCPLMTDTG
jgi:maltose alpha-D-glucosyltransferase / alpha-amylase